MAFRQNGTPAQDASKPLASGVTRAQQPDRGVGRDKEQGRSGDSDPLARHTVGFLRRMISEHRYGGDVHRGHEGWLYIQEEVGDQEGGPDHRDSLPPTGQKRTHQRVPRRRLEKLLASVRGGQGCSQQSGA